MQRWSRPLVAVALSASVAGCAPAIHATQAPPEASSVSLWEEPTDIAARDLYFGPWGREHAPYPLDTYVFVERKHSGVNPGMTVRDSQGRAWSVKQAPPDGSPPEGQIEVTLSRVLSAVGYHQPPVYYMPTFTLKDDWGVHTEPGGRFRLKGGPVRERGSWSWQQNPFVGTPPYQGLLVILQIFNASDLKNSNNSLYAPRRKGALHLRYVVRDLGTALGETGRWGPRRGDPILFARQRLFRGVEDGFVRFNYHGLHQEIFDRRITPGDVGWAADLLSALTREQWMDGFRAGGYSDELAIMFIAALDARIAESRTIARGNASYGGRP
ncbi:MAG: hypothetical protein AB7Q29_04055 [Vicinamibacterales bacterium]